MVSVVSSRSTHMAEPVCTLCAKQLPEKKERILLRGQSKEAALCENALKAYLRDKHPHQDLEEILGSSSVSRQYICHTCSSLVRKWHTNHTNQLKLEAEIQGTTLLHTRISATQQPTLTEGILDPSVVLGPPQAASSPIPTLPLTRQPLREGEPSSKRRRLPKTTTDVQVGIKGYT